MLIANRDVETVGMIPHGRQPQEGIDIYHHDILFDREGVARVDVL